MSTFIPPAPAATKSAEQHEEPSEQDSFNHLLYKVLRLTSEQVQDLNDWMKHRGIPNVHEIIAQNFRKPHVLQDDLQLNREGKSCYIQSNVMVSLSLMITYIKHLRYSGKTTYFGPFYYIQIDSQDYEEWHITPPEEEVHFQTPSCYNYINFIFISKLGSPATPRSMATSLIQFPPEMDENWVRYGLAKLGQISRTKLAEDAVLCVHNTASALNR